MNNFTEVSRASVDEAALLVLREISPAGLHAKYELVRVRHRYAIQAGRLFPGYSGMVNSVSAEPGAGQIAVVICSIILGLMTLSSHA
jgi:hypothetical protein